MRRPISFDSWSKQFDLALKEFRASKIIAAWELRGIPVRALAWVYSCSPDKKALQSVFFASDQKVQALERRCLRAAEEIEWFNSRLLLGQLLTEFGRLDTLPSLVSGVALRDLPRLFDALPDLLEGYVRAAKAIARAEKVVAASRSRVRTRALVLLFSLAKGTVGEKSLLRELAVLLGAGIYAAGNRKKTLNERNLRVQMSRFRKGRSQDYESLKRLAAHQGDDQRVWRRLVFLYLVTNLLGPLPTS